jgi:hypothetical protein
MSMTGKTIVFTGTLQMKRGDAKTAAETAGAKVTGSVSKTTDILVCGTGVGAKKTEDAQKKGVEVWTEDEFVAALAGGGSGGAKRKAPAVKAKPAKKAKPAPAATPAAAPAAAAAASPLPAAASSNIGTVNPVSGLANKGHVFNEGDMHDIDLAFADAGAARSVLFR